MAGGDLHVKPNKFIESWSARREALEFSFRWTNRGLAVLVMGIAIPAMIYEGCKMEFVRLNSFIV